MTTKNITVQIGTQQELAAFYTNGILKNNEALLAGMLKAGHFPFVMVMANNKSVGDVIYEASQDNRIGRIHTMPIRVFHAANNVGVDNVYFQLI